MAIGRPSISLMSPVKSIGVAPLMYEPTAYESTGAPASLKYRIRSGVRPPDTVIWTWRKPAWSSRARTSWTRSAVTRPRSDGVSSRTPYSRSPSAWATRSASSASSLNVSTRTIRGTSGGTCRSNARAASTVSPKISTSEWGIVPVGARPASRAPAGVDAPTQPPTIAA